MARCSSAYMLHLNIKTSYEKADKQIIFNSWFPIGVSAGYIRETVSMELSVVNKYIFDLNFLWNIAH